MGKDRLAAFSDGVIAIIITIMVLELRIPHGADLAALKGVAPNFLSYVMSFVYLGIYWNMPAIAYYLLQKAIMRTHGEHSVLARALGSDIKGKISPLLYALAIPLAFVLPWLSIAVYVLVALIWLIPDRRIERALREI
jgi:uncharacterized membrane protein